MHRGPRLIGATTAAAVTCMLLAGCAGAPWSDSTATPTATATVVPTPVPNDLSSGSTARTLTAGAVSIDVNYWSTLAMNQWVAGAIKPLSLSLTATIQPSDGQKVYVQRATMTATPSSADSTLYPLDAQVDQATVSPGYLVLSPYSYTQTFNVGPVDSSATYVTLQFTFDLLVQTTPTSTEYSKQTASDTVRVAIASE